jgi:hypothetical protein
MLHIVPYSQVADELALTRETYQLAVCIADQYLTSRTNEPRLTLHLLGGTALFCAAKMREVAPISAEEYARRVHFPEDETGRGGFGRLTRHHIILHEQVLIQVSVNECFKFLDLLQEQKKKKVVYTGQILYSGAYTSSWCVHCGTQKV